MPTTVPTRRQDATEENVSRGFFLALVGHLLVAGAIFGGVWLGHRLDPHWGETDPTVGSIQASMVNALPLPPKQPVKDNEVLTSEKPSPAPTPPPPTLEPPTKATPIKPKTEVAPKPDAIPIPTRTPPVKATTKADREVVTPTRPRPSTPSPPTPKATNGDTSGVQIPQSITQLKNGTASIVVEDRAFGDRYAYYMRLIAKMVNQSNFIIDRDGIPTHVEVETRSGSPALDMSTMRAVQRIDSFGPLPAGDHLGITYIWDSH
jgi:protein TonB